MTGEFVCRECEEAAQKYGADARRVHLIRCAEDCAHFLTSHARIYDQQNRDIPFTLYRWQEEEVRLWARALLQDEVEGTPPTPRRFIRVKTRGVGLTWLVSGFCAWAAGMRAKSIVIGSRTEDMAMDLLERVQYIRRSIDREMFPMPVVNESKKKLEYANRGLIVSETASENMGSGYHPSVFIVDEWAKLDNDWKIMASVMPAVGDKGVLIGFSSPLGFGNAFQVFYDGAQNGVNGFDWKRLHWWDLGEGDPRWRALFDRAWYERQCKGLNNDPSMIAQELDCDFVQSGSPVFRQTDVDVCFDWAGKSRWTDLPRKPHKDEQVIVAIDPAGGEAKGGNDFTSIDIWTPDHVQIWHERWQKTIPEAQRRLYEILSWCTKPIVVIERNGLGLMYCAFLRGGVHDGIWRLVEVHTTTGTKETPPDVQPQRGKDALRSVQKFWWEVGHATLVYLFQRDIENRTMRLYHEGTRSELLVYTRVGPERFAAPQGQHDDQVQSAMLAHWACSKGWLHPSERKTKIQQPADSSHVRLFDLSKGD